MQLMIQNRGPTPLPIGTTDGDGYETLLPPGLEIALPFDTIHNLVMGQKPTVAKLEQLQGVGEGEVTDELKQEYAADIDQWKGRSDEVADTAAMVVWVFVRNVGANPVNFQIGDEPLVALEPGQGAEFYGSDYLLGMEAGVDPPDPPDPGDVTGTINAFSAQNPTMVAMDVQDESMLVIGENITLEALTGDPDAMAYINNQSVTVLSKDPVTLGLDMSAQNVVALTADFMLDTPPVP